MGKSEHYEMLKEISITDYAAYLGYSVVRIGRYYSLKEHDSVRIDTNKNCFWRNSVPVPGVNKQIGKGGSIIDFVMEFTDSNTYEALKQLEEYMSYVHPKYMVRRWTNEVKEKDDKKDKELELPSAAPNMKRVFAYLVKTRKINAKVVQELVDRKQLYQDNYGNCVFVSYDMSDKQKPAFVYRRGTNTYKAFFQDMEGCDYSQGFYIDYGADKLYITEAVIDALSVMTLKDNYKDWNYLALAGNGKWEAAISHLSNVCEVWLGTDNDKAGLEAAKLIEDYVKTNHPNIKIIYDLPSKKDWNCELTEGEYK